MLVCMLGCGIEAFTIPLASPKCRSFVYTKFDIHRYMPSQRESRELFSKIALRDQHNVQSPLPEIVALRGVSKVVRGRQGGWQLVSQLPTTTTTGLFRASGP